MSNKKKIILITLILVIGCAMIIYIKSGDKNNTTSETEKSVYNAIEGYGISNISTVENTISEEDIKKIEKSADNIDGYKLKTNITKDNIIQTCNQYNIDSGTTAIFTESVIYGTYQELQVHDNGLFSCKFILNNSTLTVDENECINKANEYIKNTSFIPNEYENVSIEDVSSDSGELVGKKIYFKRQIDGIPIYGLVDNTITVTGNGLTASVCIEANKKGELISGGNFVSVDKAIENIKNNLGDIRIDENANKVVIENVEIGYWEDDANINKVCYLQPCYVFTGTAYTDGKDAGEFIAIEAIKN